MKATRRGFLVSGAAGAASFAASSRRTGLFAAAARQSDRLKFGLAADAQYADSDTKGTRFYRHSLEKLGNAVEHFNRHELAFCVHLGDLIDHTWGSFDEILKPLAESRHAFHHLLGNHDFDVLDEYKPQVSLRLNMPARYHFFDQRGFRFIVLDTNDVSTYGWPDQSPEKREGVEELKRLQSAKIPQAQSYNGGLGRTQLKWFDQACRQAAESNLRVIVFGHHPAYPENVHNIWNSDEVLKVIDANRNVVAWFNGHNHAGAFGVHDGVPFVTVHGMVETAATTAYATAEVFPDRLVVTGHDREPSRELMFRKA